MIESKDIQPGAVVEHSPSQQRYQIAAIGKMRTSTGAWATAARYSRTPAVQGEEEFYRAIDEFDNFELLEFGEHKL